MAGLATDHTACGRLTLALRAESGCTLAQAQNAYGDGAAQALADLVSLELVSVQPTRPKRWTVSGERAFSGGALRHTEVRNHLVYGVLARMGPLSVAQIMEHVPDTQHRIEQALVALRLAGEVTRERCAGNGDGDRRSFRYAVVS